MSILDSILNSRQNKADEFKKMSTPSNTSNIVYPKHPKKGDKIKRDYITLVYDGTNWVIGESDVCYIELNNWFCGRDYPVTEPFISWIKENKFSDKTWCKENRLCVCVYAIDMSVNYLITAPKSWVKSNCPKLLTEPLIN